MRAISYTRFGPASEVLCVDEVETPTAAPGEVLVRLHASGVNPTDTKLRSGHRPGQGAISMPAPKIVPHNDGAGVIEAVGEGVSESRIGERVWTIKGLWGRPYGTAAEYIALPVEDVVHLPENQPFEVGASLGIPALAAWKAVHGGAGGFSKNPVDGKIVLVSGGAGTVGRMAVQIAKAGGARVLATTLPHEMDDAREAGASEVFDFTTPNLAEQILDATDGKLIDRIVEVEFGANLETNAKIIADYGVIASYGSSRDYTPTLPFYPLMFKGVTIEFVVVSHYRPELQAIALTDIAGLLERGELVSPIHQTFDLADCAKAHEIVEAGNRKGAVILTM